MKVTSFFFLFLFMCLKCRVNFRTGSEAVCQKMYKTLVEIQTGVVKDNKDWIVEID